MGRYYYNVKDTVESTKHFSVAWLNRRGFFVGQTGGQISWSRNGEPTGNIWIEVCTLEAISPYIRLRYRIKESSAEEWSDFDYKFNLSSIPCHFGGKRWFFECGASRNGVYCGRRCAVLYECGNYFVCRRCADLTYESCNTSRSYREGIFKIISNESKAEDLYMKIKRKCYAGKPTRKYRQYLKYNQVSPHDIVLMNQLVQKIKSKQ